MTTEMEPMSYQSRMHAFEEILDSSSTLRVVDIPQLRALALQGIPEHPVWMRSRIWRLLLGALPPEKDKWEDMARKSRTRYYDVAAQLLEPIQTAPPPEYPLNARDKLLDTIAKDVDRTQPRIPFFRRTIDPLQAWPKPHPATNPPPESTDTSSDGPPKTDLADALFDRLAVVQRVVRFGNSAPPPIPRTPEIRVMVDENTETPGNDAADKHPEVKSDENAENSNSAANKDAADSDSDDDDDQPLAFKAGGRSSLGLSIDPPSPHLSPQLAPYQPHTLTPTLQLNGQIDLDDPPESKTHAHVLLRILYVYSLLHPHHPYTQGLNELLAPLYYAVFEGRSTGLRSYGLGMGREEMVGEAAIRAAGEVVAQADSLAPPTKSPKPTEPEDDEDDPTQHIEADTFWLFVELMGELGGVVGDPGDWSLPPVASGSEEGVRGVMTRLSERLRWADARLWEDMVKKSLDPKLPYFSYRWIACLLAQDLPLTALLPVWDTLFAQNPSTPETNPKIEWLINICVALLIGVRDRLVRAGNKRGGVGLWGEEEEEDDDVPLSMIQSASGRSNSPVPNGGGPLGMNEAFVQGMLLLQRYPLETVGLEWVINKAFELSAKRAAGFGIIESNNAGGAGWGGINVNGAWDVAAAMRNRVAGWRTAPAAPATQGAASTTPVPDVLVSPPAPSLASVGGKIRQYTETFKQSDTAASLSKASTNWSLAVMSAWNRSGQQQQHAQDAPSSGEAEKVPAPPPKDGRVHGRGHNRSDSWAGWGAAAVAAAKLRAAAMTGARAADVPESVAEEDPEELEQVNRRDSVQWDPRDRGRQSPRSQSLSPTALTRIAASTQPLVPQQRTATYPHPPTPRSAREPPSDYEPPPRPAVFKNPRDSWLPTPKQADTHSNTSQEEDAPSNVPPAPSPNQRFTMTLPGWSAMPPSSPSASSHTAKKTTGPKPLLLGKSRQTTSNTTSRLRMSRQSSVSSSTGSHREWELMAALSPRSDSGSMAGRPDSGSFAARSRRSIGTGSMPASAAGSLAPSEDEAVVVGLGLMRGSSDQDSPPNPASGASSSRFSPPVIVPRASSRPTSTELKRTSSPLSMSIGTGGSFSAADTESAATSPRGWQLADGPVTAEPAQVRKWELTDGPSPASVEISESRDKLVPSDSTTVRKFELTDGPAPGRASTTSALGLPVVHDSPDPSPTVPPAPRKWELTDNPVPRREPNPPRTMTADSDAAESPVLAPGETRTKAWPKRSSSNRPTNLTLRAKTRTSSSSIGDAKTPAGDGLRTPHVEENLVTPTSATTLPYLRTPTPGSADTPLPQVEERTPRRKKQGQASPVQNRRSKAMRGAARSQDVMSEEDGVKADAEDGEEYEDLLSAYETETDDTSHGAGHAR